MTYDERHFRGLALTFTSDLKNVEFDIELSANPLIYRQSSLDLAKGSEIIIQNRILKKSANSDIRLDLWFNVTAKLLPKNTLCISQTVA